MDVWGLEQADRYIAGIRKTFDRLLEFPKIGLAVHESADIRQALFGQHRILYRETAKGIEIGRVVHQARDFTLALGRYEEQIGRDRAQPDER